MAVKNKQEYIYIVQASLEPSKCKIGKTNDLARRLKEYNNMTGKSQENYYQYLFICQVEDMTVVEQDLKIIFLLYDKKKANRTIFIFTLGC